MSRHKWRVREPYDDTTQAEQPRILRRSFEMILSRSDQTPGDVTAQTGLPTSDIETLSALPTGYLANYSRVALLSPATRVVGKHTEEEGAQIISLSRQRHVRTEGSAHS